MEIKYNSFGMEDFLDDPYFIQWIKNPKEESNDFWIDWIKKNPSNLKEMQEAATYIRAILSTEKINTNSEDAQQVWNNIESTINQAKVYTLNSPFARQNRVWWAAAAVFVMLAGGAYFILNNTSASNSNIAVNTKNITQKIDIAPGGNRAILTLSDGKTIVLDSAQNGLLSKQGNTQVVKLENGKLAYEQSGISNQVSVIQYNTITTPRGGQYQLTLSDGSQVWLNAASSITFPTSFVGDKREVKITGEAYFEVAHNAKMPFKVQNGETVVTVLGTHFNVNTYQDEAALKVTLLEGSVEVKNKSSLVKIEPGQQAAVSNNAASLGNSILVQEVDIDKVIAWKNGIFVFDNTDLATIMRQVSRWYDVDVVYDGKITGERFGGGLSKNLPLSNVLKLMEANGVQFKLEGRVLRVIP